MIFIWCDSDTTPALSEPETQAVHKHIKKIRNKILSAITIHSYGQDIYYPKVRPTYIFTIIGFKLGIFKGFLKVDHPDQIKGKSVRLLRGFAKAFNKALKYRIGSVAELLEGNTYDIS